MKFYQLFLATCLLAITAANAAPASHLVIETVATAVAPKSSGPYSQGVIVDLRKGRLLYVSGQSEDDPKTGKMHDENIAAATDQTLNNIEAILKAAGTSWKNVVKVEVFLKSIDDWKDMNKEYVKRFPTGVYPARVAVQAPNGYRIEIAVIAFVPDKV